MQNSTIDLTEANLAALDALTRQTVRSMNELVNEAVERLVAESENPSDESRSAQGDWRAALRQARGMWKDREDIPALMDQLRREASRVEPPSEPL